MKSYNLTLQDSFDASEIELIELPKTKSRTRRKEKS